MKIGFRLSAIVLSVLQFTLVQAAAQSTPPESNSNSVPDEEVMHQELRDLKKVYEDAVNSGDLTPLAPAFGPETSGVVALNEQFQTLAEMQRIFDHFKNMLGPGYVYKVTLNPERSLIYGNIAITRGTSEEFITSNGHQFKLLTRWSATLRRENGHWRLLRSHVSMDPFHNEVTDYFFSSIKKMYGGGGLAIGVAIGGLLGYFLKGRRSRR